jgi:hypothetical protein
MAANTRMSRGTSLMLRGHSCTDCRKRTSKRAPCKKFLVDENLDNVICDRHERHSFVWEPGDWDDTYGASREKAS